MNWVEVLISTCSEAAEAIAEKLLVLGAYGIATEDPEEFYFMQLHNSTGAYTEELIEEYPTRNGLVTVKGYFEPSKADSELLENIQAGLAIIAQFLDIGPGTVVMKTIHDKDWANVWKQYYHAHKISPRVVIVPSWEEYAAIGHEQIVLLDPGSAFGTGGHVTTILCAEMLDEDLLSIEQKFSSTGELSRMHMLDLGCGSGILSIHAAKLGVMHIDAVDIDESAVCMAQENIIRNQKEHQIRCFQGEIHDLDNRKYHIIVANIIADVIQAIAQDVYTMLDEDGVFIAGGIINTKSDVVARKYLDLGFQIITRTERNDWVTFRFRK